MFILNDRVNTAIQYAFDYVKEHNTSISVEWYLSGGSKYHTNGLMSEASMMKEKIKLNMLYQHSALISFVNSTFVLDEKATNTAENFIIANNYISNNKYNKIYVVTSIWHKPRAKYIADLTIANNNFEWILGDAECCGFRDMEPIHINNVPTDVEKALIKIQQSIMLLQM